MLEMDTVMTFSDQTLRRTKAILSYMIHFGAYMSVIVLTYGTASIQLSVTQQDCRIRTQCCSFRMLFNDAFSIETVTVSNGRMIYE
jgi:hypothetical protein